MLTAEIIKKIKKTYIKSNRLVNTIMAGHYKSVFRGTGIEFEEVREYTPGDEVKSIDWKVSARFGRPFVKRYKEERELIIMLLIDMSASGFFGTGENTKQETIAEVSSILAFNAIRNNDKVGAILFTDRVEKYIPPKKGSAHVWRVIREIFSFNPSGKGTDIGNAAEYLGRVCGKRTVTFLISDFLDIDYSPSLKAISRKHELIAIVVSDSGEFQLPEAGIALTRDLETSEFFLFDLFDKRTRNLFNERKKGAYDKTLGMLKSANIDRIELRTDKSVADALTGYFRLREKRLR